MLDLTRLPLDELRNYEIPLILGYATLRFHDREKGRRFARLWLEALGKIPRGPTKFHRSAVSEIQDHWRRLQVSSEREESPEMRAQMKKVGPLIPWIELAPTWEGRDWFSLAEAGDRRMRFCEALLEIPVPVALRTIGHELAHCLLKIQHPELQARIPDYQAPALAAASDKERLAAYAEDREELGADWLADREWGFWSWAIATWKKEQGEKTMRAYAERVQGA
ncbi:MAG: hypothetical protein NTW86_15240 [Candidatus Sumerlaeota bacterium]|nr:hypothetical protein [Candidatus Sumerlaeota bacterium]